jgi:thiol-disulfide isomerase/thioredoxin
MKSPKPKPPPRPAAWPRYLAVGILAVLGLTALNLPYVLSTGQPNKAAAQEQPKFKPNLKGGVAWLNTEKPIELDELKGRVVLLDFWTLCCINCIHTLPDLAKLEAKYPGVLVVIGVHSPKFPNEEKTESIRKAVLRYEIKHPVVNDANRDIWRRFGVEAWPTLILIDPDGQVYGYTSGEGRFDVLDEHIGKLVKSYKQKGTLKEDLLPFQLARLKESPAANPLYFPGKILADEQADRLFIADSTHHRIVITDLAGKLIDIAGSGKEGKADGSFADATFSDPQGMTETSG